MLFSLPRRRNRLFERRSHLGVFGHRVRGLRHARLASDSRAYGIAITPSPRTRHSLGGPAMRRGDWSTEAARNLGPALEWAFGRRRGFLVDCFGFHDCIRLAFCRSRELHACYQSFRHIGCFLVPVKNDVEA
jgi:hypothetical protein